MSNLSKFTISIFGLFAVVLLFSTCVPTSNLPASKWQWETLETNGQPTARHEAGLVAYKDKLYLLGGRRINPTSVFAPNTNTWTEKSAPPIEIHHFQPVVFGDAIYIIGAMTGGWPTEKPLEKVLIYYPERDEFVFSHDIPKHRRRGGAGVVVYNDKIYIVGGITKGHMTGFQSWLDEYNPKTGEWKTLKDAPHPRDHFQAVVSDNKLYAFAGRTTSRQTNQDMSLTLSHGNIYDFKTAEWQPVYGHLKIPTERAGNSAIAWNGNIIIGGGESSAQVPAHSEVETFNTKTKNWTIFPSHQRGRHGTGFAIVGDYLYTASGCGNRGGNPELTSIERLKLPAKNVNNESKNTTNSTVYSQYHTITLSFEGEATSEMDDNNPFLNYRLMVEFEHEGKTTLVRGFYAADGNAAETSADAGNIWQVRFTPEKLGVWRYRAKLVKGENVALSGDWNSGTAIPLKKANGHFLVTPSYRKGNDFRNKGHLGLNNGYFKFNNSDDYFMKAGANSPENFLAFIDFDGTYRMVASNRAGEAQVSKDIHKYEPHLKDWKTGDPTWKNGKGKAIVGAVNYLAAKGMNAVYFTTFNIQGDGKDVWMYASPDDFTRFDVSKLAQWEILFQHMQAKGILLHFMLQETENETLLDNGNTGKLRKLYFLELIARFGHHNALVWNIGEENGPNSWSEGGQNDAQRKAMASFIKQNDPYQHPVIIHTLPSEKMREGVLNDLLGFEPLDGISLQQDNRKEVSHAVQSWRQQSKAANHEWLVTMDEIGMWHTGALTDTTDVNHPTLTRYALWGSLLSGAAGVEWYFGGRHVHNDLTSEDWRQRDRLWEITNHAKVFFKQHLPYWNMQPQHDLISEKDGYCFQESGETYALYVPNFKTCSINLNNVKGQFQIQWYNPFDGGDLQKGSIEQITGGKNQDIGLPPSRIGEDWVVLIKK